MGDVMSVTDAVLDVFKSAGIQASDYRVQGVMAGVQTLSIRGRSFRTKIDGEETVVNDPRTGDPASTLPVIVLRAADHVTKRYYGNTYTEGETAAPVCQSFDGQRPAEDSPEPQAHACAACPWNVFGSAGNGSRGKACKDYIRLAVTSPDLSEGPYLLSLPATTHRNWRNYQRELEKAGLPVSMVVTKLSFDPATPYPLLRFERVGMLDDVDLAKRVVEKVHSEEVSDLLGEPWEDVAPAPEAPAPEAPAPEAPAPAPEAPAPEAPAPAPEAPAPEAVADEVDAFLDTVAGDAPADDPHEAAASAVDDLLQDFDL